MEEKSPEEKITGKGKSVKRMAMIEPSEVLTRRMKVKSIDMDLKWDDFDHTFSVFLAPSEKTRIVYEKNNEYTPVVLRSCDLEDWTPQRLGLIRITKFQPTFLSTRCYFPYNGQMYIGCELADVSLLDIIDCTIPLSESHIRATLQNVVQGLRFLHSHGSVEAGLLAYGSLRASSVFLDKNTRIKLAISGSNITPVSLTEHSRIRDCRDVGCLALHMMTGEETGNCSPKTLAKPSSQLFRDFLKVCSESDVDMARVANHRFLRATDQDRLSLRALVIYAERSVARPCYLVT